MIYIYQPAGRAYVLKIPNHLGKQTSPVPVLRMTNTETKETFTYSVTYIRDDYYGIDMWIGTINNMRPGEYEYEIAGNRGMIWVGNPDKRKRIYSGPENDTVKYYRD
jgi:hypothetical protein